jgi:hypothetical protein
LETECEIGGHPALQQNLASSNLRDDIAYYRAVGTRSSRLNVGKISRGWRQAILGRLFNRLIAGFERGGRPRIDGYPLDVESIDWKEWNTD